MARRPLIVSSANVRLKAVRRLARRGAPELCLAEGARVGASGDSPPAPRCRSCTSRLTCSPAVATQTSRCGGPLRCRRGRAGRGGVREPDGAAAGRPSGRRPASLDEAGGPRAAAESVRRSRRGHRAAREPRRDRAHGLRCRRRRIARCRPAHRSLPLRGDPRLGRRSLQPPCATATTARALAWLREREVRIVATTPAAHEPYWASSYTGAVAVALGSERHGLPPVWLEAAGEHVSVPVARPGRQPQRRRRRRGRPLRGGAFSLAEPVDPLCDRLGPEPLEELLRVRPPRLGEQHLAAQLREELGELLGVARLVEEVGAEDEVPRRRAQEGLRLAPADAGDTERRRRCARRSAAAARSRPPPSRSRARRRRGAPRRATGSPSPQPSSRTRSPRSSRAGDVAREREAARPELGPVRQELLLVERRLVDQLVGARRAEDLEASARPELDLLLDEVQSAANRSTGTPSGSRSCA